MEIRQRLGHNVRRLIEARGISIREFANHHGIHRSLISRVIAGEANLTIVQLDRLARALNTSPEKLLSKSH